MVEVKPVGDVEGGDLLLRELGLGEEEGVGLHGAHALCDFVPERRGQAPGNVAAEAVDAEILHPVQEDVSLVVEEAGGVEVKLHDVGPVEAVRWGEVALLVAPEELRVRLRERIVGRDMVGHPVEDYAQAQGVRTVDEFAEVLLGAEFRADGHVVLRRVVAA